MNRIFINKLLKQSTTLAILTSVTTAFVGLNIAWAAGAEQGVNSPPRTVTWYADNPRERARVELACLDDPGKFSNNPDCRNAHQAAITIALREARSRTASTDWDIDNPAFWSSEPEARQNKILLCRISPQLEGCEAARRSLLIESGQEK